MDEVIETVLREMGGVVNRAWYKCKSGSPNSELLMLLSHALVTTALERKEARESRESLERDLADAKARHDAEEREIRERLPAS